MGWSSKLLYFSLLEISKVAQTTSFCKAPKLEEFKQTSHDLEKPGGFFPFRIPSMYLDLLVRILQMIFFRIPTKLGSITPKKNLNNHGFFFQLSYHLPCNSLGTSIDDTGDALLILKMDVIWQGVMWVPKGPTIDIRKFILIATWNCWRRNERNFMVNKYCWSLQVRLNEKSHGSKVLNFVRKIYKLSGATLLTHRTHWTTH